MAYILVVDDEEEFTAGIADYLQKRQHDVATANSLAAARTLLDQRIPDMLLLDLMLPDGNGIDLLTEFQSERPDRIVLITGHSGIKSLIGNMAGDGITYMRKPISPRELLAAIDASDAAPAARPVDDGSAFGAFVGESDAMQTVYKQISQVAGTNTTVFVQGESGTGKELVADAVHRESGRKGSFVPVNCGGLTRELLSAQLFGHEKGSFTGAAQRHAGFFERAHEGTLFLDEITETPAEMQTHLLRVLETGKVLRVGAEKEIDVDTRLVVASNRDPVAAINSGALREDLYFRISVFPINVPPLRDRGDDIELLAKHFLNALNKENETEKQYAAGALDIFRNYEWPGNVRELKHTVQRCYLLAEGDVVEARVDSDFQVTRDIEGLAAGRSIADVEKDLILKTLEHFSGDKKAAAESLGISLKTLYNRLNQYGTEASA